MHLWAPSNTMIEQANLSQYREWVNKNKKQSFTDYHQLWEWSVTEIEAFWETIWQYFDILHDGNFTSITNGACMPRTKWFDGVQLNYAEHIFRKKTDDHPAIIFKSESGPIKEMTWKDLEHQTASLRHYLKEIGVHEGDRVAGYLPCIPEATVSFWQQIPWGRYGQAVLLTLEQLPYWIGLHRSNQRY
jgi:acetoacetyl-CoA synthetase